MPDDLGSFADAARDREAQLVRRLAASVAVDNEFEAVLRGAVEQNRAARQRLDAIEGEIREAAATWRGLDTPAGARQFQRFLIAKTREIHKVVADGVADNQSRAATVQMLSGRYGVGGKVPLEPPRPPSDSPGSPGEDGTNPGDVAYVGGDDRDQAWRYPWEPPPPADSAPGGGRWDIEGQQAYPAGPGGGPPLGPVALPRPSHREIAPVTGASSGLQEVVAPQPNGWGVQPAWTLQEAYRFRVVGESFNGSPSHLRWVQRDGQWYQAKWIDYNFEAEHVRALVPHNDAEGYGPKPWGINKWNPVGINDIYKLQIGNPRLTLSLPTPGGGAFSMPAGTPRAISGG
ncbi:DUF4226 domain-containing protein [[Mycobacterium] zoologicum]|uniref:DUF4226 domain-containing protein n=1 Tax=[Mycobacterium] zoologicum TaxID=2872311 RepID=UPI001CDABFC4|nr:DUF4226 domain-containing protein [Mycolicibacter sp. MYC101]MEB3064183.1 DUF4226 domain-containing protein [Mycolicibacter sp. MYC101]